MKWYIKVLKNYAVFQGRAHRTEFWIFTLIHSLILFGLTYLGWDKTNLIFMGLALVYAAATLLPSLAVAVRRLHDVRVSGWWLLLALLPVVGAVGLLFLLQRRSYYKENRYGPFPHEIETQTQSSTEVIKDAHIA